MGLLAAMVVLPMAGDRQPVSAAAPALQPGASNDMGSLRVGVLQPGGRYSVSTLSMETYVARVVAGEAMRDSHPAALEALAIAVRTFALANRGRHRADGFDVCDQTHCQVVRASTQATESAAQATAGRVLLRNGAPASIYYTASCGGRTEKPSAVWPGAVVTIWQGSPSPPPERNGADRTSAAPALAASVTARTWPATRVTHQPD